MSTPIHCMICEEPVLGCPHGPVRDAETKGSLLVAIDPGDVHVGIAQFRRDEDSVWECVDSREMSPEPAMDWLANMLAVGAIDTLVVERFIVEKQRAPALAGTELETAQMIGVIRWLHRHCKSANRWPGGDVTLVMQTNKIKVPTRSILRAMKYPTMASLLGVTGDHATDAELHGYHHIKRTLDEATRKPKPPRKKKAK